MVELGINPYHAKYFAYEITKRLSLDCSEKFAATLLDAQVDLNPHQIDVHFSLFDLRFLQGETSCN